MAFRAFPPVSKQGPACQQQSGGAVYPLPPRSLPCSHPGLLCIQQHTQVAQALALITPTPSRSLAGPHGSPRCLASKAHPSVHHSVRFPFSEVPGTSRFYCCTHYPSPPGHARASHGLTGFLPACLLPLKHKPQDGHCHGSHPALRAVPQKVEGGVPCRKTDMYTVKKGYKTIYLYLLNYKLKLRISLRMNAEK